MRHRVVAGELDHVLVAGQPPVDGQRERLEPALAPEPREERRRRPPLVVAPLGPHVMEAPRRRRPRPRSPRSAAPPPARSRAASGRRPASSRITWRTMRVRLRRRARDRRGCTGRAARPVDPDHHALGRPRGVERGERPVDRRLPAPLEHAEDLARPVDVRAPAPRPAARISTPAIAGASDSSGAKTPSTKTSRSRSIPSNTGSSSAGAAPPPAAPAPRSGRPGR